jgi:hypothetical protein
MASMPHDWQSLTDSGTDILVTLSKLLQVWQPSVQPPGRFMPARFLSKLWQCPDTLNDLLQVPGICNPAASARYL